MTTTSLDLSHQIDMKNNALFVKDIIATGKVISQGTLTVDGASTQTGAIVPTAGVTPNSITTSFWTFGTYPLLATAGTDTACSNGDRYWAEVYIPDNVTLTGVQFMIGSVGGTDKVIVELHDTAGVLLATSALAGVTVGTAANVQAVPFTATYAAVGPARYFIVCQFNGTTAKFRTHVVPGLSMIAGTVAGTFGTSAAITPGTTYTASKGPIAATY